MKKDTERLREICKVALAVLAGIIILGSVIINHAIRQAEKEVQNAIGECHENIIR